MNVVKRNVVLILVFTIVWVILNEKAELGVVLSGVIFSAIALFLTDFFLLEQHYADAYSLRPLVVIAYLAYLVLQIYKSGFSTIMVILRRKSHVEIFDYVSTLEDDLAVCLLANSITLTPGTVTADKRGNRLKILTFETPGEEKTEGYGFEAFEKLLKGLRP